MKALLIILAATFSCGSFAIEKAEGIVYCHGTTVVEYGLVNPDKDGKASDAELTVNGKTTRYMTAYSWFGSNKPTPKNFKFAILGEKQFDPLLVFETYLLDSKNQKYTKCN